MQKLVTGGARGADAVFSANSPAPVKIWSFDGHWIDKNVYMAEIAKLGDKERKLANGLLAQAAKDIGRHIPHKGADLLRRNVMVALEAEKMYAVAPLEPRKKTKNSIGVDGGTGWTCQLFVNMLRDKLDPENKSPVYLPLFLFTHKWKQSVYVEGEFTWEDPIPDVFRPSGVVAGVGARALSESGKRAIEDLMRNTVIAE